MSRHNWTHDELLPAFNLYCRTPFGRLHRNNPDIIQLATFIGRTPSAVAMKLVNFASLDPTHQRRKVSGLRNASRRDREVFEEFSSNWEQLAFESEQALERLSPIFEEKPMAVDELAISGGPTDRQQIIRVRTVQRFFRAAVLASYENSCAMCGIAIAELLNASHIIPWSESADRRADPTNGLALCCLHDRAFDRGLLAVDADHRIIVADRLRVADAPEVHRIALITIEGERINLPHRFQPDGEALRFHRDNVFQAG